MRNIACERLETQASARKSLLPARTRPAEANLNFSGKIGLYMTDELLRFRSEFPILERSTYMISNSLGAMPRGVYDSVHSFCDIWATRGVRAWEEQWWMMAREVGDEIGAI